MTKRIQTVQTVGAMALVFILQACGGSNDGMTGAAGTTGSAGSGSGTAGTTGSGTGVAGTTGSGGATGSGGSAAFGEPACASTVTKGGACTATDQQMCYKTCGPAKSGVKLETCTTAGTYSEMSGCTFDRTKDFACYKIPATANTACPAGVTPQGSMDCGTVPECMACNSLQGVVGGQYLDSTGAAKPGWCVCQAANGSGLRSWSCASDTAWPCPLGSGC
jgi:hypothetical protein